VSYEDRKSTWNSGVRKAIRRGSAEEEVICNKEVLAEKAPDIEVTIPV